MRTTSLAVSALLSTLSVVNGECAADNCLRALRATQTPGRLQAAQSFCATYTTASVAATAIPTWAANACKENQNGDESYRLSSACSCIAPATTATSSSTTATASPTEACAIVSSSWAVQIAAATPTPVVAAELAHACLNSIPLGKEEAIEYVDAILPYLEWQSDAAYKANPPADYPYPAYDIFANLAKVRANLVADVYANEYEFQSDLYLSVFGPGHDGHFVVYPDALTKVFDFRRQVALVSIAEEGSSLPVIKVYEDMLASPDTASIVKLINGIDAATYLQDTVDQANWNQDKDAAYNSMFHSLLNPTGYFKQGGRIRFVYQGPTTTLTFENGTVATLVNTAGVRASMSGVVDGPSYYAKFCAVSAATTEASSDLTGSDASIAPGYPEPVIGTSDGIVTGYFLEGEGYEDVAVLALTAFESESVAEFQAVTQEFLANATAAGKTKLVLDFQDNGGGYILLGYDFFRQLFPTLDQGGDSRWKENDAFYAMSEIVSDAVEGIDILTSDDATLISYYESWFNWRYDLNDSNAHFTSFDDKFAPHIYENTKYTNNMRWDLNDPLMANETFGMGIEISGFGSRSNLTQPFAPEDIVIIYDGVCASTCTLASEFLRNSAGVKSIAFGGRPIEGPIQGLSGIKGAQVLSFSSIWSIAQELLEYATTDEQKAALKRYSPLAWRRSVAGSVNTRDQILADNINDGLPAQFVRELSECRLYWTWPMMTDTTAVWKAAATAAFNGGACAAGGIEKPAKRDAKPKLAPADKFRNPPITAERRAELLSKRTPNTQMWEAIYRQVVVA